MGPGGVGALTGCAKASAWDPEDALQAASGPPITPQAAASAFSLTVLLDVVMWLVLCSLNMPLAYRVLTQL